MRNRTSSPRIVLALLSLPFAACTGKVDMGPVGPGDGQRGFGQDTDNTRSNGDGVDTDGDGIPDDEEPAGLGTEVLALCSDTSKEQPGPRLLRLMTRRELANTVADLLHVAKPDTSSLPIEPRVRGFDNNAGAAAVTSRHVDEYYGLAEKLADEAVTSHKSEILSCDPSSEGCARTFVTELGLRAFRRPLEAEEIDRYSALFDASLTQGSFDQGMRLVIAGMLVSPSFLYRSEVGEPQGDGTFELTQYEIASALSYLYWGTMPDATLFEAAQNGALSTPEALETQARRMLDDPRAREQLGLFSLQWLRSDGVLSANKDKMIYPEFSDSLRESMLEEQRRFFNKVVLDDEGSFKDLFLASYVMANPELATFYGYTQQGTDFAPVDVTGASDRGGLLGLGAVLASHAHSNESSPIKRGLFVRDRLLCQNMPAPPANLDTTPPGLDPTLTTRERFAQHTADPACAGCHKFIDGVGFGFEAFDGIGKERHTENGLEVDQSGEVLGLEGLDKQTKEAFDGPRELAEVLAESSSAQACLSIQFYRYARGYEERKSDACSLAALQKRFETSNLTVKDLLVALPTLHSFVVRTGN